MSDSFASLQVRPYQLLHIVARSELYGMGAGAAADLRDERLTAIWAAIRADPFTAVTLRANSESVYRYQNPGHADDTPEGALFNLKRDLDILQRLGLFPGATKPARELFARIFAMIPHAEGILYYARATSPAWAGSNDPSLRAYDRAIARGLDALFPPKTAAQCEALKKTSVAAIAEAESLKVRPHHLLCITCSYGHTLQGNPEDRVEDNRFEIIDAVRANPEIPIMLIPGCCSVCPPCLQFDAATGLCEGDNGTMMLRDQKKDLDLLQLLGLEYGATVPARELLAAVFAVVASPRQICGCGDGIPRSLDWQFCGGRIRLEDRYEEPRAYALGREARWGITDWGRR